MKGKPPEPAAVVATIPAQILARQDLSYAAKALFGCIYSLAISHSKCFVSNGTLAERMGATDRRYIQRLLRVLEAKKLIEHRLNPEHHRDEITITWQPGKIVLGKRKVVNRPGGVKRPPRGGQLTVGGGSIDHDPESLIATPRQRETPPRPPEPGGGADDLIDRAQTLGLAGTSEAKVRDTVGTFGRPRVLQALDVAETNAAKRWSYVVSVLERWQREGAPPTKKREPKRPEDLPAPKPPPPADDAIGGPEAAARIRAMLAGVGSKSS